MAIEYIGIFGRSAPPRVVVLDPQEPIDVSGCKRVILIRRDTETSEETRYDVPTDAGQFVEIASVTGG